jgi:hypothetical protein
VEIENCPTDTALFPSMPHKQRQWLLLKVPHMDKQINYTIIMAIN